MEKLNQRLTLVANLAVIAGIVFLALEMRQNTSAIRAQTRDAMTERQMQVYEWIGTSPEVAAVYSRGSLGGPDSLTVASERVMFAFLIQGYLREWENSHYQYEQGLFSEEDFQARVEVWRFLMSRPGYQSVWTGTRTRFSPRFRAAVDQILEEVRKGDPQGSN